MLLVFRAYNLLIAALNKSQRGLRPYGGMRHFEFGNSPYNNAIGMRMGSPESAI